MPGSNIKHTISKNTLYREGKMLIGQVEERATCPTTSTAKRSDCMSVKKHTNIQHTALGKYGTFK